MRTLEGHAPEERYYLKRKKKREDMRRQHSRRSHTRTYDRLGGGVAARGEVQWMF